MSHLEQRMGRKTSESSSKVIFKGQTKSLFTLSVIPFTAGNENGTLDPRI